MKNGVSPHSHQVNQTNFPENEKTYSYGSKKQVSE